MRVIEKIVEVQGPVDTCFDVLSDVEAYRSFIHNTLIISPMQLSAAGKADSFHAINVDGIDVPVELDYKIPTALISWKTLDNDWLVAEGTVTLKEIHASASQLEFSISYEFLDDTLQNNLTAHHLFRSQLDVILNQLKFYIEPPMVAHANLAQVV